MLEFNQRWRITPPSDGEYSQSSIPTDAIDDFFSWITRISYSIGPGSRKGVFEHFKTAFSQASGKPHYKSSSADWAESDLRTLTREIASENAPVFIDAFWTACQTINKKLIE